MDVNISQYKENGNYEVETLDTFEVKLDMNYELADRVYGEINYGLPFPEKMGIVTVTPTLTVASGMPDATVNTYNYAGLSTYYKLTKAPDYK